MGAMRRLLACAFLCAVFAAPIARAQEEIGATPDAPAVTAPAAPDKTSKALPPSVEDVPLPPAPPPGTMEDMPIAELQALDKVTARVTHIEAHSGQSVTFGSLSIAVKTCRRAPPEDPPESAAFLAITEQAPGAEPTPLYSGWMFASSPSLAAMDHPIYDIWLTECRKEPLAVVPTK